MARPIVSRAVFVVSIAACLIAAVSPNAQAAWPHDPNVNVPMCLAANDQINPTIVSDGAGGAIVTWYDYRSGTADIYAQRVNAAGVPQWTGNGVALCTAADDQATPTIASDGAGGAIVTWHDYRSGTYYDIYAQRVNAAGVPQWTGNGVVLCTAANDQIYPTIASDGAGGAIVTWYDIRSGASYDIYAQRVNAAGVPQWTANGVALCTAANGQISPTIVSDDTGGAIVTWVDMRSDGEGDIYAQRVNAAGLTQWTGNGIALCTAANGQVSPTIASDGSGGAIVTWQDFRSGGFDIYAQRVGSGGIVLWPANGVLVCNATGDQLRCAIASDGAGGAIVAWDDQRVFGTFDVYAQRVAPSGTMSWTLDGVPVSTAVGFQQSPTVVSDGAGGAIIAWNDSRGTISYDIYAQRVTASGAPQWTTDGVAVCTAAGSQNLPVAAPDGSGGAIVAWYDTRSGTSKDIYAQRLERFGNLGNPEPSIAGVRDVPNDQGGKVKVSWSPSYLDADPAYAIGTYWVWRSVPPNLAAEALAHGANLVGEDSRQPRPGVRNFKVRRFGIQSFSWEYVGSEPAQGFSSYSHVVPTVDDSVGASNPRTGILVEAHSASSGAFWDAAPDSGYSVDNLPPVAPSPFTATFSPPNGTFTSWGANAETDLAGYRLYRGGGLGFTPSPANRIYDGTVPSYHDAASTAFIYKVCAYDIHGNEGGCTAAQPPGTADAESNLPRELTLAPVTPNPARGGVMMRLGLPRDARVSLAIFDAQGRRVRTVLEGVQMAGWIEARWDGRDESGARTASGLYFARLEAMGRTLRVRFAVVR